MGAGRSPLSLSSQAVCRFVPARARSLSRAGSSTAVSKTALSVRAAPHRIAGSRAWRSSAENQGHHGKGQARGLSARERGARSVSKVAVATRGAPRAACYLLVFKPSCALGPLVCARPRDEGRAVAAAAVNVARAPRRRVGGASSLALLLLSPLRTAPPLQTQCSSERTLVPI